MSMPEGPALLKATSNLGRWLGNMNTRPSTAETVPPPMPS
jgi:hypothetical protein